MYYIIIKILIKGINNIVTMYYFNVLFLGISS